MKFLILVLLFVVSSSSSSYLDDSRFGEIECSIIAILSDQIEESAGCNLKHLLKNDPLFKPLIRQNAQKKRSAYEVIGMHTCDENEPCRIGRSRSCLCPENFVCDTTPANKDIHLCVKLGYLRMFGVKK
ncbi:unnamed protein product [Caenorhabditis brenneri]